MSEWRNDVETASKEVGWTAKTVFWKLVLPVAGLLLAIGAVGWGIRLLTLPARTIGNLAEKTLNADNVLYNYEWFKQQQQSVTAADEQIVIAVAAADTFKADAGPRDTWDYIDKQEFARLNAVLLGLRNHRQNLVADYNARSRMANRNIFKGRELPETLQ